MYKVEYCNDNGDWVLYSWHRNKENAFINAEVKAKQYASRVIFEGKIIQVFEKGHPL